MLTAYTLPSMQWMWDSFGPAFLPALLPLDAITWTLEQVSR